jgi:hypothetical protein
VSVVADLRPLRVLAHVLRPGVKRTANARALAFLKLALAGKSKSVLFATFPKSGWNWSAEVLDYCVTKHVTGSYEIRYRDQGTLKQRQQTPPSVFSPADGRSSGRRRVREMFPQLDLDFCLHTHAAWREAPLAGLDAAKTLLVVRNIPTTLYSYFRSRGPKYASLDACLADGALDRIIRFYNSWGDFCARPGACWRVFRYEAMRAQPLVEFRAMFEFVFGFDVGETVLQEALDHYSFQRQKEREWRFTGDEKRHFHFRGAVDYSDLVGSATMAAIHAALKQRLRHDFGYNYDAAARVASTI